MMKSVTTLKTPITYYGGKQQMLRHILPLIPEHKIYTESFLGGGAVFWSKAKSEIEVINDVNANVVTFYRQLCTNFDELKILVDATLHSRAIYKQASVIYNAPFLFNEVQRAWAFWVQTSQGFMSKPGSWGYDRSSNTSAVKIIKFKSEFTEEFKQRLDGVQIECNDALSVIQSRDMPQSFHYVDPPYIGSDQGHYAGYTEENFIQLLEILSRIQGKFLLSSYPSEILDSYIEKNGWKSKSFDKQLSASNRPKARKIEVLTANFDI